jgi:hypothetical protein
VWFLIENSWKVEYHHGHSERKTTKNIRNERIREGKRTHSRFLRCVHLFISFLFLPHLYPKIEQEKGDVNEISSCLFFSFFGARREIKRRMSDDYPTINSVTLQKERKKNSWETKKLKIKYGLSQCLIPRNVSFYLLLPSIYFFHPSLFIFWREKKNHFPSYLIKRVATQRRYRWLSKHVLRDTTTTTTTALE